MTYILIKFMSEGIAFGGGLWFIYGAKKIKYSILQNKKIILRENDQTELTSDFFLFAFKITPCLQQSWLHVCCVMEVDLILIKVNWN